jgi:hypothetical protein
MPYKLMGLHGILQGELHLLYFTVKDKCSETTPSKLKLNVASTGNASVSKIALQIGKLIKIYS